jgi:hypothetical protein
MMQSFLGVADEERVKNSVVRTWVRQIRDLAYDVDDYFEVFVHLDLKKSTWWWRMVPLPLPLPSCIARPLPLDEAVDSIKRLRARVEDVSQRNLRYRLIGDSGSKKPIPEDPAAASTFVSLRGMVDTAWKQRELRDLTTLIAGKLQDQPGLQVISVWAAAGDPSLKATSIIRKAFADPGIRKDFTSRAWAKPMQPFNPQEFLRSLLSQFYANSLDHEFGAGESLAALLPRKKSAAETEDDLVEEFLQQMKRQRYLVVIEDLSTMLEWDTIRLYLPDGKNGSRIIVSTRHLITASLCTGEPYQVSGLRDLADDNSICVFFNEVKLRAIPTTFINYLLLSPSCSICSHRFYLVCVLVSQSQTLYNLTKNM